MNRNLFHDSMKAAVVAAFIFCSHLLFSQGNSGNGNSQGNGQGKPTIGGGGSLHLPFWNLKGNASDSTNFAGTTNNFPFFVKVNNIQRASFTNSGMELVGNFHSTFASVDSTVSSWKIITEILQAEAVRSEQYYQNDTLVDLLGMQSAINTHDSIISGITASQWITTGTNSISYTGNATVIGNLQSNSITTADLAISDKFYTKTGEIDSTLCLERDTASGEGRICTKTGDLGIQSDLNTARNTFINADNTGRVGIGTRTLTEKLTVDGNVAVSGAVNANTFNAEKFTADTLFITRILPAVGDSEIHFGESSVTTNPYSNRISFAQSNLFFTMPKGLSIGNKHPSNNFSLILPAHAWAENSIAIGQFVGNSSSANNSIVIGSGDLSWGNGQLINDKPNSLMVGFNSAKPTLFVSTSNGQNTTGNVGVGTDVPVHKLDVRGHIGLIDHLIFNSTSTHGVINWPEGKSLWFRTNATPGDIFNYTTRMIVTGEGKIGIGTENPQAKFQVNVSSDNDVAFAVYNGSTEQFRIMGDGRFYGRGYKIKLGTFPDYVFGKNYKRMTPDKKAKYFDEFHRLPYMPSAAEIEKDGLDVGDGLIGVTRNVEENSLDINDLFKQNAELIKRIEKLEEANKEKDEKIKLLDAALNSTKK